MAWSTPKTWGTEVLTSADMNQYIRDNQNFLKDAVDPLPFQNNPRNVTYSTNVTSWANVDATNLSATLTTTGGNVLLGLQASCRTAANNEINLRVAIDGDNPFYIRVQRNEYNVNASFVGVAYGLTAGSHVFRLQWKTTGGTNYLVAPLFWVREV
jgi:hypothetical protein